MYGKPIANKYYEGKMKRTLKRGLKDLKSLRRKAVGEKWFPWEVCGVSITFLEFWYLIGPSLELECAWLLFLRWSARWGQDSGKVRETTEALMLWAHVTHWMLAWGIQMEIVQKRLLLTRLETRTKESTPYASLRVWKPEGVAKASIRCEPARAQHRPTLIFEWKDWARAYLVGPERWWTTLE